MCYPDLVQDGGCFYLSETDKINGRIHKIPNTCIDALFAQFEADAVRREGLIAEALGEALQLIDMPSLPDFAQNLVRDKQFVTHYTGAGLTLELSATIHQPHGGITLFDSREPGEDRGIFVYTLDNGALECRFSDGWTGGVWRSDERTLTLERNHIGIIWDGKVGVIRFIVNGHQSNGNLSRVRGWGQFCRDTACFSGPKKARLGDDNASISLVRIYDSALMTGEMIGNMRASADIASIAQALQDPSPL